MGVNASMIRVEKKVKRMSKVAVQRTVSYVTVVMFAVGTVMAILERQLKIDV